MSEQRERIHTRRHLLVLVFDMVSLRLTVTSYSTFTMDALIADAIEPLAAHLSLPSLARLGATCKTARTASGVDSCWRAAAQLGTVHSSRQAAAAHGLKSCVFCSDITANATVHAGKTITLDLGSANPPSRRVAAAHSLTSVRRFTQLDFAVRELSHGANHHCVLWIGVLFDKAEGRSLGRTTHDAALAGYDVTATAGARFMGERFTRGSWSMNAIGSSGAVWSDASVVKLHDRLKFGKGDTVSLLFDHAKRELRVRVAGPGGRSTEAVAVRRLVRSMLGAAPPRMHAIVHLTDVAVPAVGQPARAVVEVVGAVLKE